MNEKIIQTNATVVKNISMGRDCRKITLNCPEAFAGASPGQFVTLAIPGMDTPLLRRPFSIHALTGIRDKRCLVDVLFKIIGNFTKNLAEIEKHGHVNILGPLGRGFTLPEKPGPFVLIGGGIGIAPLVFLAKSLSLPGPIHKNSRVFIGGRTAADILCIDDFTRLGYKVTISTQDGTMGEKAIITEPFSAMVSECRPETIYACGPIPMLKAIHKIAASHRVPCQVSVETVMACGIGVCLGCAIRVKDANAGFRHVCKDGPVFDTKDLWQ